MKTFEFDGEKYEKASSHQKEWGDSMIQELSLKGREEILDLGCGDGRLTEELAGLVPDGNVLGIDASKGMIATAKNKEKQNLSFRQMDINQLDFENKFDVIFSNAALHWVKDHVKLLENSYRALKAHGVILWDFGGDGNCANFQASIREVIQDEKYKAYFEHLEWPWYMPKKSDYEAVLSSAGFSDYWVTEVNRDRYFANKEEIIKWIDQPSIVPFIGNVPDEQKEEFRADVIKEVLKRSLREDGTCFETFRRIHVRAVK